MKIKRMVLGLVATIAFAVSGVPLSASADCQIYTSDGGCTNACKETGKVVAKLTNGKVPWDCTQ